MAAERKQLTTDEIVVQMIGLAEKNYNCSQILMILALQQEGKENPGLVRAMSGLGDGCGFFQECKQICGGVILQTYNKVNEILVSNNMF